MDVVTFSSRKASNGKVIAIATLNSERSLNALSLPMIELLEPQLVAWRDDPEVACVWLEGAGEKAFCAGGDIVAMYNAMRDQPRTLVPEVEAFFTREYQLDYLIQTYPKPFVVWGSGIVMGGGMGLMNGASHRIVTETSRLAMPEVSIGLYPDVGGTYFLNRITDNLGLFLGLTGAHMNANDAIFLSLADHFAPAAEKEQLLAQMAELPWGDTAALNKQKLTDLFESVAQQHQSLIPRAQIKPHHESLSSLAEADTVADAVERLLAIDGGDDKWLARAQKTLAAGCPMTAHIVWNQLRHGADLNLADCFKLELTLSVNCAVKGDFAEGIRALLIDKDLQPKWSHASVADVPAEDVDDIFMSPWAEGQHPLSDLATRN